MKKIPTVILQIATAGGYGRGLLRGIAKYAAIHGPWNFYTQPGGWGELPLKDYSDADGIISHTHDKKIFSDVKKMNLHTIFISGETPGYHSIINDSEMAGKLAAEHFLSRCFKHFAYCGVSVNARSKIRCEAFCARISHERYGVHIYNPSSSKLEKNERELIADWLTSLPKPVGIMAFNDNRGRQVLDACRTAGLRVPEDVAIVGVDNDEVICTLCTPSLSSINLNTEKAGYDAAELLNKMMNGKKIPPHRIIVEATHIVTRQSTNTIAINDPHVAKAINFINENSETKINAEQVAIAVGTPKKLLERRFREFVGRSIIGQIKHAHAEHIAHKLTNTRLSIAEIANSCQYSQMYNLTRFFRQEKGLSPSQYRKRFGKL